MAFADHLAQMDTAIMATLNDGLCGYQGDLISLSDISYILDRDYELFGSDGVAQQVTTLSLSSLALGVPSRQGDQIVTPDRVWTVQQTLEDDGSVRRLYVT